MKAKVSWSAGYIEPVVKRLVRDPVTSLRLSILATRLTVEEREAVHKLAYEENYDVRASSYRMDPDVRRSLIELGLLMKYSPTTDDTLSYHGVALAVIAGLGK